MKVKKLSFGLSFKSFPIVLQTEATECGLACVAILANYYGYNVELRELRQRFPVSLKGMNLGALTRVCKHLELSHRALRVNLKALEHIKTPCILHWNFNHYVVLVEYKASKVVIIDPAIGKREVDLEHLSSCFTGIVVEVWPSPNFQQRKKIESLKLPEIVGNIKGHSSPILLIILLAILLELITVIFPFFMQLLFDNAIVTNDVNLLKLLGLGFLVLYLMKNLIIAIRSWFLMYLSNTLNLQWKENIFSHLLSLPISFFQKRHIGDITSRLSSIDIIQRTLTTSFVETLLDGFMSFVIILILFNYNITLALIILSCTFMYVFVRWVCYTPINNLTSNEIIYNARQQTYLLETIRGIRSIKLFRKVYLRRNVWLSLFVDQINAKLATQKLEVYYTFFKNNIFDIQNILVIWLGASLVIDGNITVGALIAFIAYKTIFDTRVVKFIDNFTQFKTLKLQAERLSDIVLSKPEEDSIFNTYEKNTDSSIEFIDVNYQYSLYEKNVLNSLTFKIESGESVAIIGPSGCGKSTIFSLILGVNEKTNGVIKIGGLDLANTSSENILEIIGVVMQDDQLFSGSIMENICFFDQEIDEEWLYICAEIAGIKDEIKAMPMQFQTFIGDMGTVLSGGQKQRILLARALYKRPRILLLDEATSHLDIKKEQEVNEKIKSLDITRLIIAHRLETILSADRILFMNNGSIEKELSKLEAKEYLEKIKSF